MNRKFGFTLVELMVVVAVMIVLTGVGSASLSQFNNNQQMDGLKDELMTNLNLARNMAITNQLPDGVGGGVKYVLINLSTGTSVRADAVTNGGNINYFSKENKAITTTISFGFSVENGRLTNGSGVLGSTPLCLTLYLSSNINNKRYIYIDASGVIYEKNSCP